MDTKQAAKTAAQHQKSPNVAFILQACWLSFCMEDGSGTQSPTSVQRKAAELFRSLPPLSSSSSNAAAKQTRGRLNSLSLFVARTLPTADEL